MPRLQVKQHRGRFLPFGKRFFSADVEQAETSTRVTMKGQSPWFFGLARNWAPEEMDCRPEGRVDPKATPPLSDTPALQDVLLGGVTPGRCLQDSYPSMQGEQLCEGFSPIGGRIFLDLLKNTLHTAILHPPCGIRHNAGMMGLDMIGCPDIPCSALGRRCGPRPQGPGFEGGGLPPYSIREFPEKEGKKPRGCCYTR